MLTVPEGVIFRTRLASVSDTFVVLALPGGRFIVGSPGTLQGAVVIADVAVRIGPLPLQ